MMLIERCVALFSTLELLEGAVLPNHNLPLVEVLSDLALTLICC